MELLLEFIFELYLELMMFIVPEEKTSSKKYRNLCLLIAIIVLLGVFALFIWGAILLVDHGNKWGILPITIGILISLVQIIVGFVLYDRKSKGEN